MKLKNLFNSRNKNFARLNEAGDYLGRRLRENLVIFDIHDADRAVTFVTESNALISCNYKETKGRLTLENFMVEDLEKITSDEAIDNRVENHIHKFMESLVHDRFDTAEISFDKIIESFTMRAQIEDSRKRLNKRLSRFNESYNIFNTKAYKKFTEALPLLKKYLEENVETLSHNGKLVEGLRLSKVVGETYDLPRLTLENLKDEFVVVPTNSKKTLYEMVCDKELVRKELLEAKESFSRMWTNNDTIATLASHIYSTDRVVKDALQEAVAQVPYIALSNKVDLVAVMDSVYQVNNPGTVSQKDIRDYVNKIYEFKKPLKQLVIQTLNEKYGVNVQSLRFVPSFKGLAEVQAEVLSMISESCDEGILCDVLNEFSHCMSRKGGVQVLDVANTLSDIMQEAKFTIVDVDEDFHMKKLADYLSHNLEEAQYYGDDDEMSNSGGNAKGFSGGKKRAKYGGNKGDIPDAKRRKGQDKEEAEEEGDEDYEKGKKKLSKKQKALDKDKDGDIEADDLKKLRKEAVEAPEMEAEKEGEQEEEAEEDAIAQADAQADGEETEETDDTGEADDEDAVDARNQEWKDLVSSLESVTKDLDMNFDEEDEEQEDVPPAE